jgi:hypothetical protein
MPTFAAVLNHERKSPVSIVYPLSGNNESLTMKEAASTAAKMAVSFLAVKLTALPLRLSGKYLLSWDKKVFQNEGHGFFVQTGMKQLTHVENSRVKTAPSVASSDGSFTVTWASAGP